MNHQTTSPRNVTALQAAAIPTQTPSLGSLSHLIATNAPTQNYQTTSPHNRRAHKQFSMLLTQVDAGRNEAAIVGSLGETGGEK